MFVRHQHHDINQIGEGMHQNHQGQVAPALLKEPVVGCAVRTSNLYPFAPLPRSSSLTVYSLST